MTLCNNNGIIIIILNTKYYYFEYNILPVDTVVFRFVPDPFSGTKWSECSAGCGGGIRSRVVNEGITTQRISCNTQSCEPGKLEW